MLEEISVFHGYYVYVVHLHPAVVNGLTCGAKGKEILEELFPGRAVWMDEIKPGYTLAMAAKAVTLLFVP